MLGNSSSQDYVNFNYGEDIFRTYAKLALKNDAKIDQIQLN